MVRLGKSMPQRWMVLCLCGCLICWGVSTGIDQTPAPTDSPDIELAQLLVKLEIRTRAVIAGHFSASGSGKTSDPAKFQQMLIQNKLLPAAVADEVFSETVPSATGQRAWVKMVVDVPRNPNNRGDEKALKLLSKLKAGAPSALSVENDCVYYGEPIAAKKWCLACHGDAKGTPDPYFPQFKKNGWKEGDVIGGVISRVQIWQCRKTEKK